MIGGGLDMTCYVILYHVMIMITQINGLINKSSISGLTRETTEEITTMIQDWLHKNKASTDGARVYHINMGSNGGNYGDYVDKSPVAYGKRFHRPSNSDKPVKLSNRGKRKWIKFNRPNKFPGFRYYGSLNGLTPSLLDPSLAGQENHLQWNGLLGHNLLENDLSLISHLPSTGLGQYFNDQLFQNKFHDDQTSLLGQNFNSIKGNHDDHHYHHPKKHEHKHDHNHNHNHNHEHKHHYHVTKTKKEHIHHVTVPIPYPIHIKVQRHHREHHGDHHKHHHDNHKDIKPWLLAAAIGLPLILGALLLPLGLLFLTTVATLFAALAGRGGLFGGATTLIPVTSSSTTTGRHKRSIESKIYNRQSLDALYILIMKDIYSIAANLQRNHSV